MTHLPERNKSLTSAAAIFAVVCFVLLFGAARASADTYVVDMAADDAGAGACTTVAANDCSLRSAITLVNLDTLPDTITFEAALGSVALDSPLPAITNKLTINGGSTTVVGSGSYVTACLLNDDYYAFDVTGAQVALLSLPIHNVCARPIRSHLPPPTIRIGPRRADNTVSINGSGGGANVDIYRADAPAAPGEASSYFESAVAPGGTYSLPLPALPAMGDLFTATTTDANGLTSAFAAPVSRPFDLTSPVLNNAVAVANNAVRLDFSEAVSGSISGGVGAFGLAMGGANRQITSVSPYGNSIYLASLTTPWAPGEAGSMNFTLPVLLSVQYSVP